MICPQIEEKWILMFGMARQAQINPFAQDVPEGRADAKSRIHPVGPDAGAIDDQCGLNRMVLTGQPVSQIEVPAAGIRPECGVEQLEIVEGHAGRPLMGGKPMQHEGCVGVQKKCFFV